MRFNWERYNKAKKVLPDLLFFFQLGHRAIFGSAFPIKEASFLELNGREDGSWIQENGTKQ